MNYDSVLFFDIETSGLIPEEHDIIQIAAVDPITGDEFEQLLRFKTGNASKEALKINGYNEELWDERAVTQRKGFQLFRKFIEDHATQTRISRKTGKEYKVAVMAGHNIDKFDMQFLRMWEQRQNGYLPIDYACYDTLQLARWVMPDLKGYRLEDLARHFDVFDGKCHNALHDVKMNIKIAAHLIQLLNNPVPDWAIKFKNEKK